MSRFQSIAKKQPPKPSEINFEKPTGNYQTKIVAFSGKLGAGKSSCANFLHGLSFIHILGITNHAYIEDNGKLYVRDKNNNYQLFDIDNKDQDMLNYMSERVWPFIKKYSCADTLKETCHKLFGISYKLLYGNQEDKNTPTNLLWENMPVQKIAKEIKKKDEERPKNIYKSGIMTVRDVLEYFGTEILRKMHNDCHAEALVRKIQAEHPMYAVIDDVRFLNEVKAIQSIGGKVIRLTLTSEEAQKNTHQSNVELDSFNGFDAILDNSNMTMEDSFNELAKILTGFGWFKVVE